MAHCQKGSRQWRKYRRALNYILSKSRAQLTDALHKTTREFVHWCLENTIKDVVVGDVEGIQRHTSPKKKQTKRKRSRRTNQKLSQWTFSKTLRYLQYKLAAEGISLKKVNEAYTAQTCPVCGKRKKPSSRKYRCACGYVQHRDLHGASNILTQHIYGHYQEIVLKEYKYLRIA